MKKLLLILICLFVSFEVRSKSDDLSGKKLLCDQDNFLSQGFEFVSSTIVKVYSFVNEPLLGEFKPHNEEIENYSTTLTEIKITDSYLKKETMINRQSLNIIEDDGKTERSCILFKKDLKEYFFQKKKDLTNSYIKKQKI